MPRKRKVVVADQENKEPEEKIVTITKKADKNEKPSKKQKIEPVWALGDGLNVIKIILSVQKNDCNGNKCAAELTKLYKKVNIISIFSYFNLNWIFSLDGTQQFYGCFHQNDSHVLKS